MPWAAGDACGATAAATASLLVVPPAWGAAALVLLLPAPQAWLVDLFVGDEAGGPGQEAAERLRGVLREMLVIVAGLVLLDGVQTVLSGVIQASRRERERHNQGERLAAIAVHTVLQFLRRCQVQSCWLAAVSTVAARGL